MSAPRDRTNAVLAAIVVVGVGLRMWHLGVHSIWSDEAATIFVARSDDIVAALRADRHPPLSFLLFRWWMSLFGEDDVVLRLLPALASCASLVLLARLARAWLEPRAVPIAVALAAVSPIELWIAHEVRMYAFVECTTLVALTAAWSYARRPRWSTLALVFAACAVATGLHYFGAFTALTVTAIGVLAWKRADAGRSAAVRLSAAAFAGAAAWIPWLVLVYRDQHAVRTGFLSNIGLRSLLQFPACLLVPRPEQIPPPLEWTAYVAAVPISIAFAFFVVELVRSRRTTDAAAFCVFACPPLGALAAAIVGPLNFIPRYFAGSTPGMVLCVASGMASVRWRLARVSLATLVIGGALAAALALERTNAREDWRTACTHVERDWKPGDRVIALTFLEDDYSQAPLRHYWRDSPQLLAALTTFAATKDESSPAVPHGRIHLVYCETTYAGDAFRDLTGRFHVVFREHLRGAIQRLTLE